MKVIKALQGQRFTRIFKKRNFAALFKFDGEFYVVVATVEKL